MSENLNNSEDILGTVVKQVAQDNANPTVGEILRAKREELGLTHEQVHESLRINVRVFKSYEENNFKVDDYEEVYLRAFLKSYASFLGLDPKPLLREVFGSESLADIDKYNRRVSTASAQSTNGSGAVLVALLVVIVVVLGAAGFFLLKTLTSEDSKTQSSASVFNSESISRPVAEVEIKKPAPVVEPRVVPEPKGEPQPIPTPKSEPTPVTTPTNPNSDPAEESKPSEEVKPAVESEESKATKVVSEIPATGLYVKVLADKVWMQVTKQETNGRKNVRTVVVAGKIYTADTTFTLDPAKYIINFGVENGIKVYYNGVEVSLTPKQKRLEVGK